MGRRLIAIDLDDVVVRFCPAFCEYANRKWGAEIHPGVYTEDWEKMFGIDVMEWQRRSDEALKDLEFYDGLTIIDGARQKLEMLCKDYDVVAVTSRHVVTKQITQSWLQRHLPGLVNDVHFLGAYEVNDGHSHKKTKDEICLRLGASYLIDDQPKHVLKCAQAGIGAILFGDYSWNRAVEVDDGVRRAANWDEVYDIVNSRRER